MTRWFPFIIYLVMCLFPAFLQHVFSFLYSALNSLLTKYSLILSVCVIETLMQAPFKKTIKHTEKKSMKTTQVIHGVISMYYELASHEYTYIRCTNVRLLAWCFLFPSVRLLTRHEVSEMILVNKCHVSWTRFIKWNSSLSCILVTWWVYLRVLLYYKYLGWGRDWRLFYAMLLR